MKFFPFIGPTNAAATAAVSAILLAAFIFTGFISSAYKKDRVAIGQSHYEAAQSLVKNGDPDEAIEQYRKALIFSPDQTDYRLALATALIKAGRVDEAQTHLEQLLEQNPTNGLLNLMLARVALQEHRTQSALDYYQRAVYEYWPPSQIAQRRQARWELIGLLGAMGKRSELVAELMQLYANSPLDQQQRAKIGFELLQNRAASEAVHLFAQLTQQAPQFVIRLAEAYFSSGNYVAARHESQGACASMVSLQPVLPFSRMVMS